MSDDDEKLDQLDITRFKEAVAAIDAGIAALNTAWGIAAQLENEHARFDGRAVVILDGAILMCEQARQRLVRGLDAAQRRVSHG